MKLETADKVYENLTGKMYITSDQKVFLDEKKAINLAARLADETIRVVTRAQAEAELTELREATADDDEFEAMLDDLIINQ
jgi:hypothetical protein